MTVVASWWQLCRFPASCPMLSPWTTLTMTLQQLGRLQSLLSSQKAEKPGSEARRAVFQWRDAWPWLLTMEPSRTVLQYQGLGQGLRRTGDSGAQEALHTYGLHYCVAHFCHTAFILPQEAFYQSCFILQEAMLCKHPCTQEKKKLGKTSLSFATYLKLSKTWAWDSENLQSGHSQNVGHFLERESWGMSFITGMSLRQQSCQLAKTGQINTCYSPKRLHSTLILSP